jgi:hypothetical protein
VISEVRTPVTEQDDTLSSWRAALHDRNCTIARARTYARLVAMKAELMQQVIALAHGTSADDKRGVEERLQVMNKLSKLESCVNDPLFDSCVDEFSSIAYRVEAREASQFRAHLDTVSAASVAGNEGQDSLSTTPLEDPECLYKDGPFASKGQLAYENNKDPLLRDGIDGWCLPDEGGARTYHIGVPTYDPEWFSAIDPKDNGFQLLDQWINKFTYGPNGLSLGLRRITFYPAPAWIF